MYDPITDTALPRTHVVLNKTGVCHELEYPIVPGWRMTAWTRCGKALGGRGVQIIEKEAITDKMRLCKVCYGTKRRAVEGEGR